MINKPHMPRIADLPEAATTGTKSVKGFVRRNRKKFITGAAAVFTLVIVMALSGILLKSIMLLVLMAVAVLPTLYKRWIKVDMGIEFIVFAIVLVGINYGRITGAIFGATAMLTSDIITKDIGPWTLLNMAAMAAGGIIAGIMGSANLLLTGLVTVVAVDAIRKTPPILLGGGKEKFESLINTPIHLLLNLWLFMMLSKIFGV